MVARPLRIIARLPVLIQFVSVTSRRAPRENTLTAVSSGAAQRAPLIMAGQPCELHGARYPKVVGLGKAHR